MNCITFQLIREDESMSISALKMHVLWYPEGANQIQMWLMKTTRIN
jgi:hypothetical protein